MGLGARAIPRGGWVLYCRGWRRGFMTKWGVGRHGGVERYDGDRV